eukprot:2762397-Prymnesium_polylepis.1
MLLVAHWFACIWQLQTLFLDSALDSWLGVYACAPTTPITHPLPALWPRAVWLGVYAAVRHTRPHTHP